jgi:hypothetical protein
MEICMNRLLLGNFLKAAFAFGLLVLMPVSAKANQITFVDVTRGSQVSISGTRTGTFMAGELAWSWVGTAPDGFAQQFYSYCVDVNQNLASPQEVTPRSATGFTNGVTDGGAKAAWLFTQYAGGIHSISDAGTANTMAAALQVAIWEAMYDTSNSLSSGNFVLNTTGAIRTQAQTYLNSLYTSGGGYNTGIAAILEVVAPNSGQDQITSRVSEPSTLLLMGVAFFVFARRVRRPQRID